MSRSRREVYFTNVTKRQGTDRVMVGLETIRGADGTEGRGTDGTRHHQGGGFHEETDPSDHGRVARRMMERQDRGGGA